MRADWNCDVNRDGALMSWPTHRPTSGAGLAPKPLLVGGSSDLQSIRELDNGRSCEWTFRDGDVGQVDRRNRSGTDCCSGAIPSAVLILLLVLLFSAVQGVAARLKSGPGGRGSQSLKGAHFSTGLTCSLFDRSRQRCNGSQWATHVIGELLACRTDAADNRRRTAVVAPRLAVDLVRGHTHRCRRRLRPWCWPRRRPVSRISRFA